MAKKPVAPARPAPPPPPRPAAPAPKPAAPAPKPAAPAPRPAAPAPRPAAPAPKPAPKPAAPAPRPTAPAPKPAPRPAAPAQRPAAPPARTPAPSVKAPQQKPTPQKSVPSRPANAAAPGKAKLPGAVGVQPVKPKPNGTVKPKGPAKPKAPGQQRPSGQPPAQPNLDEQQKDAIQQNDSAPQQEDSYGMQPVEDKYGIPEAKKNIEETVAGQMGAGDAERGARYTELMSELGIGFGSQTGPGYASYQDVFGAPGSQGNAGQFQIRDAMGRVISGENPDILKTDVYSKDAAKNIAGTSLGNMILDARRAAAQRAEGRSSSGVRGGGLVSAQAQEERTAGQLSVNSLLNQLRSGQVGIGRERFQDYLEAQRKASENPESAVNEPEEKPLLGMKPVKKPQAVKKPKVPKAPKGKAPQGKPKPKPKPQGKPKPPARRPGAKK